MRLALRALLLATGCLVMVATSPNYPDPLAEPHPASFPLIAGGILRLSLSATAPDGGKVELRPLITLQVQEAAPPDASTHAPSPRLVGFVSSTPMASEAHDRLDPRDTFMVGQQVDGVGTVHLVREAPMGLDFSGPEKEALRLSESGSAFFTLYSPDADMVVDLNASITEMESLCQCEVTFSHDTQWRTPPDAGTGGRDGG